MELRDVTDEEGNRLLRMIRRSSGSIVTWRRAQMVLLAAQRMPAARIAEVVFSDPDTVREVIHNFNRDGFEALYPRYRGGRPRTFTLPQRQAIKRIALAVPTDLGQPFATWSLAKLADYLVSEEVVDDISHEGLRQLLREEGVSFQAVRSWKRSNDPDFETKKNRILELYAIADGLTEPGPDDPDVVVWLRSTLLSLLLEPDASAIARARCFGASRHRRSGCTDSADSFDVLAPRRSVAATSTPPLNPSARRRDVTGRGVMPRVGSGRF